jgi:hypothetical protein
MRFEAAQPPRSPVAMRRIARWLLALVILFFCAACQDKSEGVRSANVPLDAVFVFGPKVGWWQGCTVSASGQPVHCRIWNQGGKILEDEEFLPSDEGPPPTLDELKIAPDPPFEGPDRICLTNKRILLPKSRFEELKKIYQLESKPATPR